MKILSTLLLCAVFLMSLTAQPAYKDLIKDPTVNFYDVCAEAERYFETIDINAKGSGWKNFQRWKHNNEYKFYPSGRRDIVDPYFSVKAYRNFIKNNPEEAIRNISANWMELGPSEVSYITGHYAAGLGRVEDFYIEPDNMDIMYLGSRSGGFWKSENGGANWTGGSTDFLVASGVNAIAVSPWNKDSILINVQNANNGLSHGLYRSIDGGDNWTVTPFNPDNLGFGGLGSYFRVYTVAYHPTIPNLVFVGTQSGLFRSDDNLATWSQLMSDADVYDLAFHPTNPNIIYYTDNTNVDKDYVWYSTDTGLTWTASSILNGNNNNLGRVETTGDCADCVYFSSGSGVWKSSNNALTFIQISSVGNRNFTVNDQDKDNIIYGNIDMFTSTDEGANFFQTAWWSLGNNAHGNGNFQENFNSSTAYVHADARVMKSINGIIYLGTDGFLCKSTDNGLTWSYLSQGTGIRENYKLGVSQSNHNRTILGSQDNGTTIYHEDGWQEFYGADGMEGMIHPLNDDWMITSWQYGGRRRTKDAGLSGSSVHPSGEAGSDHAAWEAPMAFAPDDPMKIYHFSHEIWVSNDFGTSWAQAGVPSTFTSKIRQAAIAENDSDIIIISSGEHLEKSTDGGATFSDIQNNLPGTYIEDIAFDPQNDDRIIVTYANYQNDGNKIFMTIDGGNSWTNITYNLGDMPIHSAVIDHSPERNIYIGTELGVFTKPMSENTWSLYSTDLPNVCIEELEIIYGSNTIRAASWGRGLWEVSLLDRSDYPFISNTAITNPPTDVLPEEGIAQFVTSTITYDGTLTDVYLEWSNDDISLGNVIPMSNSSGNTWVSDNALPNVTSERTVYFKVFAVGANNDTTETYRFAYTVRPGPLPVELTRFSANVTPEKSVHLHWITASEINNDYFGIERSMDGINWAEIAKVRGAGSTFMINNYSFADQNPFNGLSYYRLKQNDLDGKFAYSHIETVNIEPETDALVRLYPNPANNEITIEGELSEFQAFAIYDDAGKDVSSATKILEISDRSYRLDLSQLPTGVYILKTKTEGLKFFKR